MILRLAVRSLLAHPVRSAVLAGGFGLGVAVMAILLGVGHVILQQARAPALAGGGHVVLSGVAGEVSSARFVLSSALHSGPLAGRVVVAAPASRASLLLTHGGRTVRVAARGGIPGLERALGDPETAAVEAWVDTPADRAWIAPDPADVIRAMDRFRPVPDVPRWADSWAEWLYFNGRSGDTRFYLTFLAGPARPGGLRAAGVRLQLERDGRMLSFAEEAEVDEDELLAGAPDMTIGGSRVELDGLRYRVTLDLPRSREAGTGGPAPGAHRITGEILLDAVPGRSLAPITIRGAEGWLSGYTVPVMAGALGGALSIGDDRIVLDGGSGYHDHNWGFWEGVSWQWGQVHYGDLSFVYGRVFPPADAADAERMPGFLAALGPDGPLAYATSVSIEETNDPATGLPERLVIRGRAPSLDLTLDLTVEDAVVNRMGAGSFGAGLDFLQLRARYHVRGRAGARAFDFTAAGAAETFR